MLELVILVVLTLAILAPGAAGAVISGGTTGLIGLGLGLFRRFNGDYRLTVADAPDGLRLRSGLIETSAETIPLERIQAIRMVEPLPGGCLGGVVWSWMWPARKTRADRIATRRKPLARYCLLAAENRPRF